MISHTVYHHISIVNGDYNYKATYNWGGTTLYGPGGFPSTGGSRMGHNGRPGGFGAASASATSATARATSPGRRLRYVVRKEWLVGHVEINMLNVYIKLFSWCNQHVEWVN